jgi:hypothetical protein
VSDLARRTARSTVDRRATPVTQARPVLTIASVDERLPGREMPFRTSTGRWFALAPDLAAAAVRKEDEPSDPWAFITVIRVVRSVEEPSTRQQPVTCGGTRSSGLASPARIAAT